MVDVRAVVRVWWRPCLKGVISVLSIAFALQVAFEPVLPWTIAPHHRYPVQAVAEFTITLCAIAWLSISARLARHHKWFSRSVVLPLYRKALWIYVWLLAAHMAVLALLNKLLKDNQEHRVWGCILVSLFTMVSECASFWLWYFVALAPNLCNRTLFKALLKAVGMSVVVAPVMLVYLVANNALDDFHRERDNPSNGKLYQLLCALWLVCTRVLASFVALYLVRNKASHPFRPYFVSSIICGLLQALSLLPSPAEVVVPVVTELLGGFCIFWSFVRDTRRWRGTGRKPLWSKERYSPFPDAMAGLMNEMSGEREALDIDFAFVSSMEKIGEGATSLVFKSSMSVGPLKGKDIVFKVFRQLLYSDEELKDIREETYKAAHDHPRIVKLYGLCVCPPDIFLAFEYCSNGSLSKFLCSHQLSFQEKVKLAIQATEAVEYLHSLQPPVLHRDLKAQNFVVTASGDCKLTDFGSSKVLERRRSVRHSRDADAAGTFGYLAPEASCKSPKFSTASDVFSLGVVLWEIWAQCEDPYPGEKFPCLAVRNGTRPTIPLDCPPKYKCLVERMWQVDPHQRPSAEEVLERLRAMMPEP